ncbi:Telomerase Cajal body protein 1 [Boothiomyces sp. JEL0866]|nr:Telomerase Cajal body protein 1 [Boothiomyces sp. JEL0866]
MNNFYTQILYTPCKSELLGLTEYNELLLINMDASDMLSLGSRIGIEQEKSFRFSDQIYSLDFYPFYNYSEQHKCFIVSVKDHPPVLYDSTFYQRQVYKTQLLGEHQTPLTVKFNYSDIYCGFKNYISVFDINGTEKEEMKIQGLVSCMDFGNLNCIGTFNGLITLYQDGYTNYIKEDNGITQIKQKDYYIVYSMRNGGISIYDTRNMASKLVDRKARNQRLYFDIDENIMFGDLNGNIKEIDFSGNVLKEYQVEGTVSSVQYGKEAIAYSVGTREFMFDNTQESFIDFIK